MKTIFEYNIAENFVERIETLTPKSNAKWGKMNVSQMLKHCSDVSKITFGDKKLKRPFISKLIGKMILKKSIKNDSPLGHNKPTHPALIIKHTPDFDSEKKELIQLVSRYSSIDKSDFDGRIHPFFGKMNTNQWGILIYKHLDHHLRQFGA